MIWLIVFACTFVSFVVLVIVRFRQSVAIGKLLNALTADERLRISLSLKALEEAETELQKAAWVGGLPGHQQLGELLLDLKNLNCRARLLLRAH